MNAGNEDSQLVRRHLLALEDALSRLERVRVGSLEAFQADPMLQWSVERGLQVCAQNVLDIAVHLAASAGLDSVDYASSIDALASLSILPQDFARALRPIAGFRNALVHMYLALDPALVYGALVSKLPELRRFAQYVATHLDARE